MFFMFITTDTLQMWKKPTVDLIHVSNWSKKITACFMVTMDLLLHNHHNDHELLETNFYVKVISAVIAITQQTTNRPTCYL